MSADAAFQRVDILLYAPGIADEAAGPVQHALAFRREPAKARAALDERQSELVFKAFYRRR